jgi:hypothetical protein
MYVTKINPIVINDNVYIEAEVYLVQTEYPSGKTSQVPYDLTGKTVKMVISDFQGNEVASVNCDVNGNIATAYFKVDRTGDMKGELEITDNDKVYTALKFYFTVLDEVVK